MNNEVQPAPPKPRKRLLCGAVSCGGCTKECGVVVYRYLAGLDEEEREGYDSTPAESPVTLPVLNDPSPAQ